MKIDRDVWLWIAGLAVPVVGFVAWHYFHADPTDVVTDVQMGTGAAPSIRVIYNSGPADNIPVNVSPALWTAAKAQLVLAAAKQAFMGITRDRVQSIAPRISS